MTSSLPLSSHYSRFRVGERLLLTGHSHQAWPDVSFEAQQQAWLDAAELVDDKWARASEVASRVQQQWQRLLNDPDGIVALGQNTHELVIRLLSALPLDARPRLVTTDGEFHTIRRQLDRWLDRQHVRPIIFGEFEDFALLRAFGQRGAGIFPVPSILEKQFRKLYAVQRIGVAESVTAHFYAVSVERKLRHPAVVAICETARSKTFAAE